MSELAERKARLLARLDAMTPDERYDFMVRLIGFVHCTCGEADSCPVHPPATPPDETVQSYLDAEKGGDRV